MKINLRKTIQAILKVIYELGNKARSQLLKIRFVIVVDDDIDITNLEEVFQAVSTRCNPETIDIIKGCTAVKADPTLTEEEHRTGEFLLSRVISNACRPCSRLKGF